MAITREQIYTIAETINTEGKRPTLAMVRRRLGSGSFTTISEALNEWRVMQNSILEGSNEVIPDLLKEQWGRLSSIMWVEAVNTATNRFCQEKETLKSRFIEKEDYYKELEIASKKYDTNLEATQNHIEELCKELESNAKKLNNTEKAANILQQNLDKSMAQCKASEKRMMELQQELNRAYEASDKLQKNLTKLIDHFELTQNDFNKKKTVNVNN